MNRGPRLAAPDRREPTAQPLREGFGQRPSFDLGIAVSIYGKDPAGRLVALQEAIMPCGDPPSDPGIWPTEQ